MNLLKRKREHINIGLHKIAIVPDRERNFTEYYLVKLLLQRFSVFIGPAICLILLFGLRGVALIEFLQQALADPVVLPVLGGAGILICAKLLSIWADRDEKESR